ncbi:hypothetical protein [Manganibacter manganicus]|uniref:Uncharacterized protein n=1 Tax=Manganibacter manganicus TaxID=1873176 RepID=A0A1V8RJ44_9HYPH|nr:hypothetical protein [Pseudaminobacter manganicus]OQM73231.1 hypothetical protein BFN67_09555 [Pseudaminobacter manganicus]
MIWLCRFPLALCGPLALLAIAPAFAGDAANPSAKSILPGVEGDYRIVRPVEAEQADTNASHFKIGNVDVRVSGSITIDVGVGSTKTPKH